MRNLKKRLTLVALALAATGAATGFLIACSSDDTVVPADGGSEASTSDSPSGETSTDGGADVNTDTFVPVEAGTLAEFIKLNAEATCARFRDCCGGTGFDLVKCNADFKSAGWAQSLADLAAPGVATGGKVVYDPVVGSACLTAVRNMTCKNTPAAEFKAAADKCFAAAKGSGAASAACRSNVECQSSAYCDLADPDGGVCTPLKGTGVQCTPTIGECAYRAATGASRCLDTDVDGVYNCGPALANGAECRSDFDCASGGCYVRDEDGGGVAATCDLTVDFIYGICEIYKPDGG